MPLMSVTMVIPEVGYVDSFRMWEPARYWLGDVETDHPRKLGTAGLRTYFNNIFAASIAYHLQRVLHNLGAGVGVDQQVKVTLSIHDEEENIKFTDIWRKAVSKGPDKEVDHPSKLESKTDEQECNAAFAGLITLQLRRVAIHSHRLHHAAITRKSAHKDKVEALACTSKFLEVVDAKAALELDRGFWPCNAGRRGVLPPLGKRATILPSAGSLAQATHVILERRDRMLERHLLPDVVEDVKYKGLVDVGDAYKSAWIDGAHHDLGNEHFGLLQECLARAVADTTVGDEKWRLGLRLAMANSPPSRSLVMEVMGEAWAAGNGRQRVPFSTTLASQQPSFEDVWEAMVAAKELLQPPAPLGSSMPPWPTLPEHPRLKQIDLLLDPPERSLHELLREEGEDGGGRGKGEEPPQWGRRLPAAEGVGAEVGGVQAVLAATHVEDLVVGLLGGYWATSVAAVSRDEARMSKQCMNMIVII
ncbi:hypothetical protein V8C86DRAFT_2445539 [Haematococcus lacustris]